MCLTTELEYAENYYSSGKQFECRKFFCCQGIEIIRCSTTFDSKRIQQIEFLERVLLKSEFQLVGYRYFKIAQFTHGTNRSQKQPALNKKSKTSRGAKPTKSLIVAPGHAGRGHVYRISRMKFSLQKFRESMMPFRLI